MADCAIFVGFYGSQYDNHGKVCFDVIFAADHVLGTEFDPTAIPPRQSVSWTVTHWICFSALHKTAAYDTGYQI